jgi:hypothetical protein
MNWKMEKSHLELYRQVGNRRPGTHNRILCHLDIVINSKSAAVDLELPGLVGWGSVSGIIFLDRSLRTDLNLGHKKCICFAVF